MCGISGIASEKLSDRKLAELTVEILKRLEYRGYDSVGMASMSEDRIEVRKAKGSVEEFVKKRSPSTMKGKSSLVTLDGRLTVSQVISTPTRTRTARVKSP